MNIKTRLSVQFTLIVAGILLFFSGLAYYFSYSYQLNKFRESLLDNAKNTAILLINVVEVDSSLLKKIQQSTISLEKEEIAITDSAFNLAYSNNIDFLTGNELKSAYSQNSRSFFSIKEKDGVYFKYQSDGKAYNVYVMAFDRSRRESLTELRSILMWSILFSVWLSVVFSYFFSKKAIKPISQIIKSVKDINSMKLSTRLNEGKKRDEIDQLAITFNDMLTNLEIAFKNQEDFVSNASHELRTPLSVMISESNYLLSHGRKQSDYISHLSSLTEDLKELNELITSLLELARINKNINIEFSDIRIDEIVFNAIHQAKIKYPDRKIIPKIQYPEDDTSLQVKGSEGLLTIAFQNLIDNACKFSSGEVLVEFSITAGKSISIMISDNGIGIPSSEIENIFEPFRRATNAKYIGGFGIGLSLVNKIIELHYAEMKVNSIINKGTRVEVIFTKS